MWGLKLHVYSRNEFCDLKTIVGIARQTALLDRLPLKKLRLILARLYILYMNSLSIQLEYYMYGINVLDKIGKIEHILYVYTCMSCR